MVNCNLQCRGLITDHSGGSNRPYDSSTDGSPIVSPPPPQLQRPGPLDRSSDGYPRGGRTVMEAIAALLVAIGALLLLALLLALLGLVAIEVRWLVRIWSGAPEDRRACSRARRSGSRLELPTPDAADERLPLHQAEHEHWSSRIPRIPDGDAAVDERHLDAPVDSAAGALPPLRTQAIREIHASPCLPSLPGNGHRSTIAPAPGAGRPERPLRAAPAAARQPRCLTAYDEGRLFASQMECRVRFLRSRWTGSRPSACSASRPGSSSRRASSRSTDVGAGGARRGTTRSACPRPRRRTGARRRGPPPPLLRARPGPTSRRRSGRIPAAPESARSGPPARRAAGCSSGSCA